MRTTLAHPWRIRLLIVLALTGWGTLSPVTPEAAPDEQSRLWTFDTDAPGTLPGGFVVGTLFDGRPAGEWKVVQASNAPSPPHVLGQLMGKGAEHAYKVLLFKGTVGADVDVQVSFLPIEGKADMGGGLIWRAADGPMSSRKPKESEGVPSSAMATVCVAAAASARTRPAP